MEREKEEAYRIYVSDSLALYNTILTKGEVEMPRYSDIMKPQQAQPQETADQIKTRFDPLRRKEA